MPERKSPQVPAGLLKKRWVSSALSLVVGLALGTTIGREILGAAGVPASCVRALQRGGAAIDTGKEVAADGRAALDAVKALEIAEASGLLVEAKDGAVQLFAQAKQFDSSRGRCDDARR